MRFDLKTSAALIPAQVLFVLLWLRALFSGEPFTTPGFINNPDAYVRLERVRQWMERGDWHDRVFSRVGVTDHEVLSWTRPLDILHGVLAHVTELIWPLSTSEALLYAAIWINLPLGLLTLYLAARVACLNGEKRPMFLGLGALAFTLLPYYLFIFIPQGAFDHHGLMIMAFLTSLIFAHGVLVDERPKAAWGLGAIQGLALWISPESLIAIAAVQVSLGLAWVIYGNLALAKLCEQATLAFALTLCAALLIDYGFSPPGLALDRLSLFSLGIAAALWSVWKLGSLSHHHLTFPWHRVSAGIAFGGLASAGLLVLNPNAVHGPMYGTLPWFIDTWIAVYGDGFGLPIIGSAILSGTALCSGLWAAWTSPQVRPTVLLQAPVVLIFCILGLAMPVRWLVYAEFGSVALLFVSFTVLWHKLEHRSGTTAIIARVLAPVLVLGAVSTNAILLGLDKTRTTTARPTKAQACTLAPMIDELNALYKTYGEQLVVAHANITPAILYHTPHRVSALPTYPDGPGLLDSINLLRSTAASFALNNRIVVVCAAELSMRVYGDDPKSLFRRMLNHEPVAGLKAAAPIVGVRHLHIRAQN